MSKEDFCGACVAIPFAFLGAGASKYGSTKVGYKKQKKILLIGMIITFVTMLIAMWYYTRCDSCR